MSARDPAAMPFLDALDEAGLTSVELARMTGDEDKDSISAVLSLLCRDGEVRKAGKRPGIARPVHVFVATGEPPVRLPKAPGHATDRPAGRVPAHRVSAARLSPARALPEEGWPARVQVAVRELRRDDWVVYPLGRDRWMCGHLQLTEAELLAKAAKVRERRAEQSQLQGAGA